MLQNAAMADDPNLIRLWMLRHELVPKLLSAIAALVY
jgi:hypothetical protein